MDEKEEFWRVSECTQGRECCDWIRHVKNRGDEVLKGSRRVMQKELYRWMEMAAVNCTLRGMRGMSE